MQLALDHHTGKEVAIKFIRHGPGFESRIVARELINQRMCYAHPHIVQLQVGNLPSAVLCMPCAENGARRPGRDMLANALAGPASTSLKTVTCRLGAFLSSTAPQHK